MRPAPNQALTQGKPKVLAQPPTSVTAPPATRGPKAGPGQLARAVFWSLFGVRGSRARHRDFASITLPQAMLAGLLGTAAFVRLVLASH